MKRNHRFGFVQMNWRAFEIKAPKGLVRLARWLHTAAGPEPLRSQPLFGAAVLRALKRVGQLK
jgi:hypothetical protein